MECYNNNGGMHAGDRPVIAQRR